MDAIECIKTRRSVRKFTDEMVPAETVREIVDCNGKNKVWTLEGNQVVAHAVKIGMTDGTHTQILGGIAAGKAICLPA